MKQTGGPICLFLNRTQVDKEPELIFLRYNKHSQKFEEIEKKDIHPRERITQMAILTPENGKTIRADINKEGGLENFAHLHGKQYYLRTNQKTTAVRPITFIAKTLDPNNIPDGGNQDKYDLVHISSCNLPEIAEKERVSKRMVQMHRIKKVWRLVTI